VLTDFNNRFKANIAVNLYYVKQWSKVQPQLSYIAMKPQMKLLESVLKLEALEQCIPPPTLTFELDLDKVKMSQYAKYLPQVLFGSKITIQTHSHTRHTHTGLTALSGPLKWSVTTKAGQQMVKLTSFEDKYSAPRATWNAKDTRSL